MVSKECFFIKEDKFDIAKKKKKTIKTKFQAIRKKTRNSAQVKN